MLLLAAATSPPATLLLLLLPRRRQSRPRPSPTATRRPLPCRDPGAEATLKASERRKRRTQTPPRRKRSESAAAAAAMEEARRRRRRRRRPRRGQPPPTPTTTTTPRKERPRPSLPTAPGRAPARRLRTQCQGSLRATFLPPQPLLRRGRGLAPPPLLPLPLRLLKKRAGPRRLLRPRRSLQPRPLRHLQR